ncbi:hypothetical protein BU23DRAFT_107907 [Bimuria novae-zelandiae CBS 107.79]|uniref:Uncharacterized protein n=1 Tax=Bimuria novae-zelandiae CBS 107.79 TaxID=1447943 RepID=A0A6A5VVW8_9PLEO|nr:hypothetical protein BU23DRAFT_107907 [Bimuria novae-zelandiae CBS 107.79]
MTILPWRYRRKSKKTTSGIPDPASTPSIEQPGPQIGGEATSRDDTKNRDIPQMTRSIKAPAWFLENCVSTAIELKSRHIPLVVREPGLSEESTTSAFPGRQFQMEPAIYAALHAAIRKSGDQRELSDRKSVQFQKTHVSLHIPKQRSSKGAPKFFQAIVEYFARDIGAHLVSLSIDDVDDIAEYFALIASNSGEEVESYVKRCFAEDELTDKESTLEATQSVKKKSLKPEFPFREILEAPLRKSEDQSLSEHAASRTPVIIHFPDAHHYSSYDSYRRYRGYDGWQSTIVSRLRSFITSSSGFADRILVISSSYVTASYKTTNPIVVAPLRTKDQLDLLQNGDGNNSLVREDNIRILQRKLRRNYTRSSNPLIEPYAEWGFLEEAQSVVLTQRLMSEQELETVAEQIGEGARVIDVLRAISTAGRRAELLETWNEEPEESKK